MIEFKLPPKEYSLKNRILRELTLLLIMIAIILFFVGINVVYITTLLLIYLLLLSMQRNRIVTHIIFDDQNENLTIIFYQFLFFRQHRTITYNQLNYKFRLKRFGFGMASPTITFFRNQKLQAEINQLGNWKWQSETITNICKKLELIKQQEIKI